MSRFFRGLLIKAVFLGIALGVVKYGPNLYARYVGPLPPALEAAQNFTLDEMYRSFAEMARNLAH